MLQLSDTVVIVILAIMVLLVIGIILFVKNRYKNLQAGELREKHSGNDFVSNLKSRTKYEEANAFNLSGTFWGLAWQWHLEWPCLV